MTFKKTDKQRQKKQPPTIYILQPTIPSYRIDFFERLAKIFEGRLYVYASQQNFGVLTKNREKFPWERFLGEMRTLGSVVGWQTGALKIPVSSGDILVLSGAPRVISNMLLMVRARLIGATVIWWGQYLSPTSSSSRHFLRVLLMGAANGMLFYTEDEIKAYQKTTIGKKDERPIEALNNGIDTVPISKHRKPYNAEQRQKALLFIGRITEKSKLELLINALPYLKLNPVTLHVIGDGDSQKKLEEQARKLGVAENIVWHGATTDEKNISTIANQCRLFVYPGDVGLSLIHGMAYGLPVVVHDQTLSHMPEIAAFQNGANGVTFLKDDAKSLADVLGNIVDEYKEQEAMSTNALETVKNDYNTASMAKRCANFIETLSQRSK